MSKRFLVLVFVCVLCLSFLSSGCQGNKSSATDSKSNVKSAVTTQETVAAKKANLEKLMKQAVCRVYVNNRFTGTASLIQDELIITAAHLFGTNRPLSIEVLFVAPPFDSPEDAAVQQSKIAVSLIMINADIDLAFLSIEKTGHKPINGLANESVVGQELFAPSFKHGKGLILPYAKVVDIVDEGLLYNASAGGGSSGAPVLNLDGELLGLCKGAIEGGLKIMVANHKTIKVWLESLDKNFRSLYNE